MQSATKPARFCRAIEMLAGPAGVLHEWRSALGEDWTWAAKLLRPTDRLAGYYPAPVTTSNGGSAHVVDIPPYQVVWWDEDADHYVACSQLGTARVELTRADLIVYELDLPSLCKSLATALGLVFDHDERVPGAPHAHRVGARDPLGPHESWAYLCLQSDAGVVANTFAQLSVRHEQPFVLITPSRPCLGPTSEALRSRGVLMSMDETFIVASDGTWTLAEGATLPLANLEPPAGRSVDPWAGRTLPTANQLTVLQVLADSPCRMTQERIAAASDEYGRRLARRTVGDALAALAEEQLVDYPKNERCGAAISPLGRQLLARQKSSRH